MSIREQLQIAEKAQSLDEFKGAIIEAIVELVKLVEFHMDLTKNVPSNDAVLMLRDQISSLASRISTLEAQISGRGGPGGSGPVAPPSGRVLRG